MNLNEISYDHAKHSFNFAAHQFNDFKIEKLET